MAANQVIKKRKVDLSTLFGVAIAFALVVTAIILGGNPNGFIDVRSILIVLLGTFAVTAACFSVKEVLMVPGAMVRNVFHSTEDPKRAALRAMRMADIARREGVNKLDQHTELTKYNEFFRSGVQMVADSNSVDEVSRVLDLEVHSMLDRNSRSIAVLKKAAEVSPAMGLIGTLIGLVQMLGNLENASTIGPAMAVALLTTFYGAVMSYMVFTPLASKLEQNTDSELLVANIYIESVNSIAQGDNPRNLEMHLNSFLPPLQRINYYETKRGSIKNEMQELLNNVQAGKPSDQDSNQEPLDPSNK